MYLCACEWCVWGRGSVRESDRVCMLKFPVCVAVREKACVCSFVRVCIRVDR